MHHLEKVTLSKRTDVHTTVSISKNKYLLTVCFHLLAHLMRLMFKRDRHKKIEVNPHYCSTAWSIRLCVTSGKRFNFRLPKRTKVNLLFLFSLSLQIFIHKIWIQTRLWVFFQGFRMIFVYAFVLHKLFESSIHGVVQC